MITTVLMLLILVSLWMGFYQIIKQQGRILLRLDQLERNAQAAGAGPETPGAQAEPSGLPLDTVFPAFNFADVSGKTVSLEDFRGQRVLLLHWNFDCGFCDSIAGELARLQAGFKRHNVQLVLLARGQAASNQEAAGEYGLKCPLLLMKDQEKIGPFENEGTPVAYLLDEEGRVAAPIARGAERVLALALEAADDEAIAPSQAEAGSELASGPADLPVTQAPERHRIELPGFLVRGEIGLGDVIKRMTSAVGIKPCAGCKRRAATLNRWMVFSGLQGTGLKAGTPAPVFHLPDLQGRMVSLEEYRGRRLLLIFNDPQCGPCDELAPYLTRLHQQHEKNGLALLLVGRGDADVNRRKAEQHGIQFPVLLQDRKWKVSKDYAILSTPAAFLIGEDGVIARDAAVGKDAILVLAQGHALQGKGEAV